MEMIEKAPGRAKCGIDDERDPGEERNRERLNISPINLCQRPHYNYRTASRPHLTNPVDRVVRKPVNVNSGLNVN